MLLKRPRSGDHVRDRVFDTPLIIRKAASSGVFRLRARCVAVSIQNEVRAEYFGVACTYFASAKWIFVASGPREKRDLRLNHMEIALMRLQLRNRHACQLERFVSAIRDDRIVTRIGQLCVVQKRRYTREQCVIDIYRIVVDVKVRDCRAAEARFEHERVVATGAENRYIIADVVERVVLRRAVHDLELRDVR